MTKKWPPEWKFRCHSKTYSARKLFILRIWWNDPFPLGSGRLLNEQLFLTSYMLFLISHFSDICHPQILIFLHSYSWLCLLVLLELCVICNIMTYCNPALLLVIIVKSISILNMASPGCDENSGKGDCNIFISKFELKSHYYIHYQTNTLGKNMNSLSHQFWVGLKSFTGIVISFWFL